MFGAGSTWIEQMICVCSFTSIIMVGGTAGRMVAPVIVGQLFDRVAMTSFTYVFLVFAHKSLLFMLALQFIWGKAKHVQQK